MFNFIWKLHLEFTFFSDHLPFEPCAEMRFTWVEKENGAKRVLEFQFILCKIEIIF